MKKTVIIILIAVLAVLLFRPDTKIKFYGVPSIDEMVNSEEFEVSRIVKPDSMVYWGEGMWV